MKHKEVVLTKSLLLFSFYHNSKSWLYNDRTPLVVVIKMSCL